MVNRDSLCKDNKESGNHTVIHCEKSRVLLGISPSSLCSKLGVSSFTEKSPY